jgi:hypothetical protein
MSPFSIFLLAAGAIFLVIGGFLRRFQRKKEADAISKEICDLIDQPSFAGDPQQRKTEILTRLEAETGYGMTVFGPRVANKPEKQVYHD